MTKRDPINPTDQAAIDQAQLILKSVRFGALAVSHPETAAPYVSRVAFVWDTGALFTLISTLSTHTKALERNPACAALIGEPGDKGDALAHPRMTISGHAQKADKTALRDMWLEKIPKAQLYYDFSDFVMYQLRPDAIDLNGGFGKAYKLTIRDLTL